MSTPCQRILHSFLFIIGNLVSGLHAQQRVVEESSVDYQYVFKRIKVRATVYGPNDQYLNNKKNIIF